MAATPTVPLSRGREDRSKRTGTHLLRDREQERSKAVLQYWLQEAASAPVHRKYWFLSKCVAVTAQPAWGRERTGWLCPKPPASGGGAAGGVPTPARGSPSRGLTQQPELTASEERSSCGSRGRAPGLGSCLPLLGAPFPAPCLLFTRLRDSLARPRQLRGPGSPRGPSSKPT